MTVIDFTRIKKRWAGYFMRIKKNAGWYKRLFFRCAKSTCDTPATYIIYSICVVAFLKEISLLYKGDTEKQSLLYIGDSESESQKHDRLFKAVFFVSWETMLCGCNIFRPIQRLRSFSLIFSISDAGVYLLHPWSIFTLL